METNNLLHILDSLNKSNVEYLVCGGLAVMAYGYLRMTQDIDLVIALDESNILKAIDCFESLDYKPMSPVLMKDFCSKEIRLSWKTQKNMTVFQIVSDSYKDCPIDLFIEEPFSYQSMKDSQTIFQLTPEIFIPVVGLNHLKEMKKNAARPRDLADLEELNKISEESNEN